MQISILEKDSTLQRLLILNSFNILPSSNRSPLSSKTDIRWSLICLSDIYPETSYLTPLVSFLSLPFSQGQSKTSVLQYGARSYWVVHKDLPIWHQSLTAAFPGHQTTLYCERGGLYPSHVWRRSPKLWPRHDDVSLTKRGNILLNMALYISSLPRHKFRYKRMDGSLNWLMILDPSPHLLVVNMHLSFMWWDQLHNNDDLKLRRAFQSLGQTEFMRCDLRGQLTFDFCIPAFHWVFSAFLPPRDQSLSK